MDYLLEDPLENIILASGATHSGDEVYIQASPENQLQQMSKDRATLTHVTGELVGITKLSVQALEAMSSFAEAQFSTGNQMLNYEDALVGVSDAHQIHVKVIEGLVWCEIDDEHHLSRALNIVYPKIKAKEI
jgi:2-aminoethylphosphonate-pyruvate transaminase